LYCSVAARISFGLDRRDLRNQRCGPGESQLKGIVTTRTGETLIVKPKEGTSTVLLTDDTTTKDDKGLFGLDKEIMSNSVLIPELKVKVDGTSDEQGRVVAKTITVDGDDLEIAQMIQSGLYPTAEQVSANMQAIEANRKGVAAISLAAGLFTGKQMKFSPKGSPAPKTVTIGHKVEFDLAKQSGRITQGAISLGKAQAHVTGPFQLQGDTQLVHLRLNATRR
jgi:hypothetical protein